MHDVVCYVARSIAFRDHHASFTLTNGVIPHDWTDKNILKNCTEIFLHDITEIPEELERPQLKCFYMKTKNWSSKIPDRFFTRMPELRVLHLIKVDLLSLPTSFSLLLNLRTLCFDECKLGDIVVIGELTELEILSFFKCRIEKLCKEMDQLSRLRLLDLSFCYNFKVFPPNVISSLTQLEELYLGSSFIQWEVDDEQVLDTAKTEVPDAKILPIGLFFEKLERYKIYIGDDWHEYEWRSKEYDTSRTLKLRPNTSICLEDGVIMQLNGIRDLHLDGMSGFRNVYELHNKGFPELKYLNVKNNPIFLSIVDSVQLVSPDAFPLLESLYLSNLVNLEKIHNGQLSAESFHQLKTIEVRNCDKLKNISSFSIASGLPNLQEVEVIECKNMEEIFVTERKDASNNEVSDNIQLMNQLRIVALKCLPELISFCSKVKTPSSLLDNPPLFFNDMVLFPNLETLELCAINSEKIWHQQHPTMSSGFHNLKRLMVVECHNLKYLFSSSTVGNFVQLQRLEVYRCATLEELIVKEESTSDGEGRNIKFPQLAYLMIECLDILKRLNAGNYIEFPSLKQMVIGECPEMKAFIFNYEVAFPSLEVLSIYRMNNLKLIWHDKLAKDSFMNLKTLSIGKCQQLLTVFPSYMCERFDLLQLEQLSVSNSGVEEIFAAKEEGVEAETKFVFPRMTHLSLQDLHELKCFYRGVHNAKWPVLEELELYGCDKIEILLASEFPCLQENSQECNSEMITTQQPIFLGFPNLKKLKISGKAMTTGKLAENFFHKLYSLVVSEDESAVLSLGSLQKFHNLKYLTLHQCSYEEIFSYGEVDNKHTRALPQIENIGLYGLGDLKQDFILDLSFQNLIVLNVCNCGRMINLLRTSAAKSLVQLRNMSVKGCNTMLEVVANDGEVTADDERIFSKLVYLTVKCLSNLTSFCSGKLHHQIPVFGRLGCDKLLEDGDFLSRSLKHAKVTTSTAKCCMCGGRL
ncbi:hypothetical protein Ddye_028458 [Dipteronia dyeriana]|uniref:Disease resistance protein At4g27190-like leucine-rich repeats domain-containing protein n=1 Tax=Dipteronia dyeriana TaxID=168575 RepID=A0AAD9TRJ7_9ROSI|nr:hypothetical protein Ddye_028458 [Dipteronia dyeriana]